MASRTTTGVAMGVALTIFVFLSLSLFVTTMVFFSQKQKVQGERNQLESQMSDYIEPAERGSERVANALGQTERGESLVSYLIRRNREKAELIAGNQDLSAEQIDERIAETVDLNGRSLVAALAAQRSEIETLERRLETERAEFERAAQDARSVVSQWRQVRDTVNSAAQAAGGRLDQYRADVQSLMGDVADLEQEVRLQRDQKDAEFQQQREDLEGRIASLNNELLILQDQIRILRGEGTDQRIMPLDEAALVDGEVVGLEPLEDVVSISLGRADKVVVGLTFSVYDRAGDIRPDPDTGEYPDGKAALEVIRVGEETSRARIVRASRGNPVVRGDVIANAVYDPDKTYVFVVYGNFDVNNDDVATPWERDDLEGLIRRWGGEVVDDIRGDVDFVVLGRKPDLPPLPSSTDRPEVITEYVRLRQMVQRYDELLEKAVSASIPVLNENRLRTLLGEIPI